MHTFVPRQAVNHHWTKQAKQFLDIRKCTWSLWIQYRRSRLFMQREAWLSRQSHVKNIFKGECIRILKSFGVPPFSMEVQVSVATYSQMNRLVYIHCSMCASTKQELMLLYRQITSEEKQEIVPMLVSVTRIILANYVLDLTKSWVYTTKASSERCAGHDLFSPLTLRIEVHRPWYNHPVNLSQHKKVNNITWLLGESRKTIQIVLRCVWGLYHVSLCLNQSLLMFGKLL